MVVECDILNSVVLKNINIMLHTLVSVDDGGQKYCPDASNAARDFTSYFTLIIKIPLSLRRSEKSSIALLQVRFIGNFTFIAKKKSENQTKDFEWCYSKYTRSKKI